MLPVIGTLLQLINIRFFFAWSGAALSILGIYIFLESIPSDEDFLTKVYDRSSYEKHLEFKILEENLSGLLVIDLNGFKAINDSNGHKRGDDVLIQFASVLKEVFEDDGLVARIGGDEFSVVLENRSLDIEVKISELKERLLLHEDLLLKNLTFGYGYRPYESGMTMEDLYTGADNQMYSTKSSNYMTK